MKFFHHDDEESAEANEAAIQEGEEVSAPEDVLQDSEIFVPQPGSFEDRI
jgi:hypothetical protein